MKSSRKNKVMRKGKKIKVKEFFSLVTFVLFITTVWIFFTWQRLQIVYLENRISGGMKTIRKLEDTNRNLTRHRAAFRSLASVTQRAKNEFGMAVIEKDRFISLDE